ncbi:MAG TPA: nitrilase-related carbon-nitrogen hydrolase, partial [Kofleriaceae bacterium]|nr:nitrilase-related carbon-nitrogen hydrolase [Kofleriaceae bacterium]
MKLTVAALQTALTDEVATNVARVTELVRQAAGRGARIVLPSELFEGHYFCRTQREADFARARPAERHPTLRHFQQLAAELGVVIPVSFYEQAGPERYNSVAVLDADGRNLGIYRKSHIPDGPGYQEKFFFKPGNTGFRA